MCYRFQDYDVGEQTVLHAVRRRQAGSRSNSGTSSPVASHSNSRSTSPSLRRQLLTRGLNDISELRTEQEKEDGMGEIFVYTYRANILFLEMFVHVQINIHLHDVY